MHILLFGCADAILFFALVQLVAGSRQPLGRCMVIASFAFCYAILYPWVAGTGALRNLPVLANSDNPAVFLAATGFSLAARTILHEGRRAVRSYLVYFAAPALFAAVSIAWNGFVAPSNLVAGGSFPDHYASPVLFFLTLVADASYTVGAGLALLTALRLSRARKVSDRAGFRHQVVFLSCYLVASFVVVVGSASRNDLLYETGGLLTGVIMIAFALTRVAVFYFARDRPPLRRRRPEWDGSAGELGSRLSALMEREAPYRDETLTLGSLASLLGEEPRRLSYYLNVSQSMSFRSYLNDLRLAAVCRDLAADPRVSILHAAFANGFNSKSTFNTLFMRRYGMTPKEFRRTSSNGRR